MHTNLLCLGIPQTQRKAQPRDKGNCHTLYPGWFKTGKACDVRKALVGLDAEVGKGSCFCSACAQRGPLA